jgi:hypothetical protein
MTQDDIIRIAQQCGDWNSQTIEMNDVGLERFAALIEQHLRWDSIHSCHDECQRPACVAVREAVKAERETVARWMVERGYATGHGDSTADLLRELDWQIAENWNRALINGITTEREACAKVCDEYAQARYAAAAIRARGEK